MEMIFKQCISEDIHVLRDFSYKTFDEAFAHMNTQSNMKDYLDKAFSVDKLLGELSNSDSFFYFLYADGELAGYIKLNEALAQTDLNDEQALEIERIYVAKEFQGKGYGQALMNKAIDMAKMRQKAYVWLGVWEKNEKAIAFYKKNGFYAASTHAYFIGEDEQTDFIMCKDL